MKNLLKLSALLPLLLPAGPRPAAAEEPGRGPRVAVSADPRVELMSVIFRLAGNKEYNRGRVPAYTEAVEKRFGPFREHPAVKYAAELRKERGISYDAVMKMAIYTTDAAALDERVPLSPSPDTMDKRWTAETARKFLALAREFSKDTGFGEFYAGQQPLYELTAARLREALDKGARLEWFDTFFGPAKAADFRVVPGLLNGGGSYGPRIVLPGGREEIYSIVGVWKTDGEGMPVFPEGVVSVVVHEFTHSYTNPLTDRHIKKLKKAGKKIYPLVAEQMREQAYGDWDTLMYESLNRACELRYDAAFYGPDAVKKAEEYNVSRGFHWVPGLGRVLAEYDAEPRRYKDLDEFFPKIEAYFNDYAGRARAEIAAYKEKKKAEAENKRREMEGWREKGPKIVSMSPENGAAGVPADLKAITITFDRPMAGGYSMVQPEGAERYPKVNGLGFDEGKTAFSMQVELQPGREYVLGVNSGDHTNFRSAEGVPLFPVRYTFKTRP